MVNEKKQKIIVLIGVLLLTGLFALGYVGINRFVFATTSPNIALGQSMDIEDDALEEEDTEVPLHDHYISLDEAETIFIDALHGRTGLEFTTSDFHVALRELDDMDSYWVGFLLQNDSNGEDHQIVIDAETGEIIEFATFRIPVEGDNPEVVTMTMTISGTGSFYINDQTANVPSHWGTEISPYHLTIEEAAEVVAATIYEEFETTLDGHTMYLNFNDNPHHENEYWQGWIILEEDIDLDEFDDYDEEFEVHTDFGVYFLVNARTGEVTSTPIWISETTSYKYS